MSPADGLDIPRGSHRELFATLLPPEYGAALVSEGSQPLLIVVGVAMDTAQQIESHLLARSYDGLLKKGKIKGR